MAFSAAKKKEIIDQFKSSEKDTGSSSVQIALLTARINHLTGHLKTNRNDVHTRFGLGKLVAQRRRLMEYYKRKSPAQYRQMVEELGIRG